MRLSLDREANLYDNEAQDILLTELTLILLEALTEFSDAKYNEHNAICILQITWRELKVTLVSNWNSKLTLQHKINQTEVGG